MTKLHTRALFAGMLGLTTSCAAAEQTRADLEPLTTTQAELPPPAELLGVATEHGPPLLPEGVTSFGATQLDGDVYILGGYFGTPHQYDNTGQSGALRRMSPGAASWELLGELEPLQSVALASVDARIVRVGGMRITNDPGDPADMHSLDAVEFYEPDTGVWTVGPSLPGPRSSHDVAVLGRVIYVLGGWSLAGGSRSGEFHTEGLKLDLDAPDPSWVAFEAPFRRRALGVAAADGKVFAIGGMDDEGELSRRVDSYDPVTGTWSQGPDYPGPAFGLAATAVGDAVIASADDGVVYRLTPGAEAWTPAGSLSFPRFFHQLVALNEGVVAVGGIHGMTRDARTRLVEDVSLDSGPEGRVLGVWRLDSPSQAKNRMAMFLLGDALYMVGGNRSVEQHAFGPEDFLSEGHRLHLPSMTWSALAPFPARRQTMQTLVHGDGALVVGGFGHDGEVARTHGEVFAYDLEADAWRERPSLSGTRSQFGLANQGDALWLFGGLDYDPSREGEAAFDHRLEVLEVDASDPNAALEPAGVELGEARRAFGGATFDGRYYMVGGMRAGFEPVTSCEVFEFETRSWSNFRCPPSTMLSPELVAIADALYLVGGSVMGEGGLEPNTELLRYDPRADQWSTVLDVIPLPAKHLRAFAFGDRLLLFSAHFADAQEAKVALIDVGGG